MLERTVQRLPIRLVNRAGAALRAAGLPLLPLTPEALERRAVRAARLADFGERD